MSKRRIHIGTSGWHYKHWVGPFYPEGTPARGFLAHYVQHFATVEINNTFYRLPKPETMAAWRDEVPKDFRFACKASRYITHMKKLKDPAASSARFFEVIAALGHKLGPILFQLPPRWRVDVGRLRAFLETLPPGHRAAFEFRDETWFTDEVLAALSDHDVAFCIYDLAGRCSPLEVTGDFVYLRLHGPGAAYSGSYDERTLAAWAKRIAAWQDQGRSVFTYFDNDEAGYAVRDALRLIERLGISRP